MCKFFISVAKNSVRSSSYSIYFIQAEETTCSRFSNKVQDIPCRIHCNGHLLLGKLAPDKVLFHLLN